MEYFILEVDEHYVPMKPLNYKNKLNDSIIRVTKPYQMPKRMIFPIAQHIQTVETDIILFPCFLVSKKVYEIIQLYDHGISFVRVLLFDKLNKKFKIYFIPFLKEIDCLTDESKLSPDKSVIYEAYIDGDKIKDKPLVRVAGLNCKCILIRLDLVESLLRRNAVGIGLRETITTYSHLK